MTDMREWAADAKEWAHLNVLRLALGDEYAWDALEDLIKYYTESKKDPEAVRIFKEVNNLCARHLQDAAEHVVLHYAARLAAGAPVDDRMRKLIEVWCKRRLRGKTKGRPTRPMREIAVFFRVIAESERNPSGQQKAIIDGAAKKLRLKRSQVYKIIKSLPVKEFLSVLRAKRGDSV